MFKSHLEMIGRNETPSKKAKFWQSYIRSLKGSDDIRAHDSPRVKSWRPYSAYADVPPPPFRSIFDDPHTPAERISAHGYRYLPVHRETYGYSPRPIYDHHYNRSVPLPNYDAERAWQDHVKRMADIERRYPSRYGLYLRDKPNAMVPLEYEPEDKPISSVFNPRRATSVPPMSPYERATSVPRALSPFRASSVEPLEPLYSKFENFAREPRAVSPTPIKPGRWAPRRTEVAFDDEGLPVYRGGSPLRDLLEPSPRLPYSSITRDPFWWDLTDLRPYRPSYRESSLPPYLRDSFLSPVKRKYVWEPHPYRPLTHHRYYW